MYPTSSRPIKTSRQGLSHGAMSSEAHHRRIHFARKTDELDSVNP